MSKFTIKNYTNNTKTVCPTDEFISRVWGIFCEPHYKKMSPSAIRALLMISENTTLHGLSSNVAFELDMPANLANTGAVLFPEEYQPWEGDDLSIVEPRDEAMTFTLTFTGEILKEKMVREITKHYEVFLSERSSNKYMIPLEI